MSYILILMIVAAAGAVVYALVRGLIAFANMEPGDVDADGITASHKKQNEMMFARAGGRPELSPRPSGQTQQDIYEDRR